MGDRMQLVGLPCQRNDTAPTMHECVYSGVASGFGQAKTMLLFSKRRAMLALCELLFDFVVQAIIHNRNDRAQKKRNDTSNRAMRTSQPVL